MSEPESPAQQSKRAAIRKFFGHAVTALLALGLGVLVLNALIVMLSALNGSKNKHVTMHITSGNWFFVVGGWALFSVAYYFKARKGFNALKQYLPKAMSVLLLVFGISRVIDSSPAAYGALDGVAAFMLAGMLILPLWYGREPGESLAEPSGPPGFGGAPQGQPVMSGDQTIATGQAFGEPPAFDPSQTGPFPPFPGQPGPSD